MMFHAAGQAAGHAVIRTVREEGEYELGRLTLLIVILAGALIIETAWRWLKKRP